MHSVWVQNIEMSTLLGRAVSDINLVIFRHDDSCECSHNTTGKTDLKKFSGFERDSNPRPLRCHQPTQDRSHAALIAQLGEHYTGNAKVVGSNPVQSLKIFSGLFFQ